MQSIDDHLAWLERILPPPKGLRWSYRRNHHLFGTDDMICLVDYKNRVYVEERIYILSSEVSWNFVAVSVLGKARAEMMRRQFAMPKDKAPKDKSKGFWGWLYK